MISTENQSPNVALNPDNIKFLYSNQTWQDVTYPQSSIGEKESNPSYKLINLLRGSLLAENLLVLTGLGTSLLWNKTGSTINSRNDRDYLAPTMNELWEEVFRGANNVDDIALLVNYTASVGEAMNKDIEKLLSHCHMATMFLNGDNLITIQEFIISAESKIASLCRFTDGREIEGTRIKPDNYEIHKSFLRKLARRPQKKNRLKLYTTNYDLCFERAAQQMNFVVVDGFSHTQPQTFDASYFTYDIVRRTDTREIPDYISNLFHLYKVHGSLDWKLAEDRIEKDSNPESNTKPHLIYPRHTKYELAFSKPYLELMAHFQFDLRKPNTTLLVCGFGFNDKHLAEPIRSAIESNIKFQIIVVSPGISNNNPNTYIAPLIHLAKGNDSRILLIDATFKELIEIMPDLAQETEAEKLDRLIKSYVNPQNHEQ